MAGGRPPMYKTMEEMRAILDQSQARPQAGLLPSTDYEPFLLRQQRAQMQHDSSRARKMPSLLDVARGGLMGLTTDVLGAPVDLATTVMRPLGYNVPQEQTVGSSDWLANRLTTPTGSPAETAGRAVSGLLSPDATDLMHLAPLLMGATKKLGSKKNIVTMFHDSPEPGIINVEDKGLFGGIFAGPEGGMGGKYRKTVDIDKSKILTQQKLDYDIDYDKVSSVLKKEIGDVSDDEFDLIWSAVIEDKGLYSIVDDIPEKRLLDIFGATELSEADWAAQRIRGRVAKNMGYDAVEMADETGVSYLVLPGTKAYPYME